MSYLPLLIPGAFIGLTSIIMCFAYAFIKSKQQSEVRSRTMSDKELFSRLARYAKPYTGSFVLVTFLMLMSIAHDVISPYLVGYVEEIIKQEFQIKVEVLNRDSETNAVYIVSQESQHEICINYSDLFTEFEGKDGALGIKLLDGVSDIQIWTRFCAALSVKVLAAFSADEVVAKLG